MRVQHINGGSMRFPGGRYYDGQPGYLRRTETVCHCLVIETEVGLVLVDSGLGTNVVANAGRWLGPGARLMFDPPRDFEKTAVGELERLGYTPSDVTHVVLTHLDADHSGGLADFPDALVHVYAIEHAAAMSRHTLRERLRYRPVQFAHGPRWSTYAEFGERWFGFDAVRQLEGLPPEILLVPLIGHTAGHAGVAVDTGSGWLLHAGDAYFFAGEMDPAGVRCTRGLEKHQSMWNADKGARLHNRSRLRQLVRDHADEVRVFSAHNPTELDELRGAPTR